jgi:hypothetical protein
MATPIRLVVPGEQLDATRTVADGRATRFDLSQLVHAEVAFEHREGPRRGLERDDTTPTTDRAGFEDGVGAEKRADVDHDIAWSQLSPKKLEELRFVLVRQHPSHVRIDPHRLPVDVPIEAAPAAGRAQPPRVEGAECRDRRAL